MRKVLEFEPSQKTILWRIKFIHYIKLVDITISSSIGFGAFYVCR